MSRPKTFRLVIDTETCPLDREFEGVMPSNMFVYDCGWAIVDRLGNVYREKSYVVDEIFNKENELMQSAYYAKKIPQYKKDIEEGSRVLEKWYLIRKDFLQDIADFNINECYAHNMRFDYGTLNNTQRWLSKSKYRYFFPYNMKICDTLKMARQVLGSMPTYKKFCEENGFMTKNNQCRMTAEVIYRFLTKNLDFTESHTGLEDVMIEKEILAYCLKKNPKVVKELWG